MADEVWNAFVSLIKTELGNLPREVPLKDKCGRDYSFRYTRLEIPRDIIEFDLSDQRLEHLQTIAEINGCQFKRLPTGDMSFTAKLQ